MIIPDALDKIQQINGVTFEKIGIDGKSLGVIAQEVKAVLPEAVNIDGEGYLSVKYGNMIGLLIEAIKELRAEVNRLKNGN